jgi:methylated-DNA-[protein]-cysteine S-methyltransferase
MSTRFEHHLRSPLGDLRLVAAGDALAGIYLPDHEGAPPMAPHDGRLHPVLLEAARQLEAYFAGQRRAFDLPLAPAGSAFQREVRRALVAIPFGATRAYADLARALGRPSAARAVGAANARNPISIIVPCHRVVAGDGALTGYAGGLDAKRWLLAHEQRASGVRS